MSLHDLQQEIIDELKEHIQELKGWSIQGKASFEERLDWLEENAYKLFQQAHVLKHRYKTDSKRLSTPG